MSTETPPDNKQSGHDRRIEGPIPEYNKFDEYTGTTYFRCRNCGAEALRRDALAGCCDA